MKGYCEIKLFRTCILTVLWGADGDSISLAPGWSEIHYVSQTGFKLALIFLPWPLSTKTAHLYRPILDTNLGFKVTLKENGVRGAMEAEP